MALSILLRRGSSAFSRYPLAPISNVSSFRCFSTKRGAFMRIPDKNDPQFQTNLDEMKLAENQWQKQLEEGKNKRAASQKLLACVDDIYHDLEIIEGKTDNGIRDEIREIEQKVRVLRGFFFPKGRLNEVRVKNTFFINTVFLQHQLYGCLVLRA